MIPHLRVQYSLDSAEAGKVGEERLPTLWSAQLKALCASTCQRVACSTIYQTL